MPASVVWIVAGVPQSHAQVELELEVVAQGLTAPLTLVSPDDGTGRLFIVQQNGLIRVVSDSGQLLAEPFLDVRSRMVGLMSGFDERGLLGLAFHPDYATNGRFFVYYSAPLRASAPAGWNNTSTFSEFRVSQTDANRADLESERVVLQVDQPQFNHAGGTLAFGPDGYLYISLGDGGNFNDIGTGHLEDWYATNSGGNAQNVTETLLGKILRIDVDGAEPYTVPSDNPFVGRDGRDEIYAYGLRNPYRMSIDMETGRVIAGDVGQGRWEEVSVIELGGNYGWNVKEGTHCFNASNSTTDRPECPGEVGSGHPDEGAALRDPVIEYANSAQAGGLGIAVVGGYIYRGSAIPELVGRYVFGDWNSPAGGNRGAVFVATPQEAGQWPFEVASIAGRTGGRLGENLMGFGRDTADELYLLTTTSGGPTAPGNAYRISSATVVSNESEGELPVTAQLEQNYPNPFNPATTIRYAISEAGHVSLVVRDVLGREVSVLVDGVVSSGHHEAVWTGEDTSSRPVPSGLYLYTLRTTNASLTRSMTLIR